MTSAGMASKCVGRVGIPVQRAKSYVLLSLVLCSASAAGAEKPALVALSLTHIPDELDLSHFPQSEYTPYGYLANPYHTSIVNRSGLIRSVPPLGFGFWARPLPWPYASGDFGFGLERHRNYLSLIELSLNVDGKAFHTAADFRRNAVKLYSRYHTQNVMSYDCEIDALKFRIMYFQVGENVLIARVRVASCANAVRQLTVHASNVYGDVYKQYWGCDGIVSRYNASSDVGVSKMFADGDVFVIGADQKSTSYKATADDGQCDKWIAENDLTNRSQESTSLRFEKRGGSGGGHLRTVMSYRSAVPPGATYIVTVYLSRGLTEKEAIQNAYEGTHNAQKALEAKLAQDKGFYANAPVLTGDWPRSWKNGLIYHFETIRMNIHPPIGIYKHHWDGMQVATPRLVLGESAIDSMCLSYADVSLAKEVLYGTFADAVAPNIPCSREDGSINLIGGNGDECGTAPIWGLPFQVIQSIFLRDRDTAWIRSLYPHMKAYLQWWLANRTDNDGWFHASNSWESGQDASERFMVDANDPAAAAQYVRTVDIEAAMAGAMKNMVTYATFAGESEDVPYWTSLANERVGRVRSMFVDGRFRDFDARSGKPIILKDYYSIMMLCPISLGIASERQMKNSSETIRYFRDHGRFWLEWPSFMFPFGEAAWNAGERKLLSEILVNSGQGIFPGMDSHEVQSELADDCPGLSQQYSYRSPGVAAEWWPYLRNSEASHWSRGCENYGWGGTFPTLLIRNLVGFREIDDLDSDRFCLAPALPKALFEEGKTYGIINVSYRGNRIDLDYTILPNDGIRVQLTHSSPRPVTIIISDESGNTVAETETPEADGSLTFDGVNGALFFVVITS